MSGTRTEQFLIVGVTTRALAASAARAGYQVMAIDAFGDRDLRSIAQVITPRTQPGGRFHPMAAAMAADDVSAKWVAYTSNLENHPRAVERLARGRQLLGNQPGVLARVRNPILLSNVLRKRGFAVPLTRSTPPAGAGSATWLLKPRGSGGGHGVEVWHRPRPVPRGSYLQERIRGIPGSVIFAANGESSVVLGLSRQLVGDSRFGAHGFRYCGSLLAGSSNPLFPRQRELLATATAVAREVTREFQLVGLNGIDFVARNGVPYPIEVNPRYSASMELLERTAGLSLFELHARACQGTLPDEPPAPNRIQGKAVVFARRTVMLGRTEVWVTQRGLADVPHSGEVIREGRPICTVFARGSSLSTCVDRLVQNARAVYGRVRHHSERAA